MLGQNPSERAAADHEHVDRTSFCFLARIVDPATVVTRYETLHINDRNSGQADRSDFSTCEYASNQMYQTTSSKRPNGSEGRMGLPDCGSHQAGSPASRCM